MATLADTSVWIDFLRRDPSAPKRRFHERLAANQIATTDVVIMEILAGARTWPERRRLRETVFGVPYFAIRGPEDYESAADIHRVCGLGGETVRKMTDCLIAAVALRHGVPVLSADVDFRVIARHTALELA